MVRLQTASGSILHFFLSETETSTSFGWHMISQLVYNSQPPLQLSNGYLVLLKGIWEGGMQFWVTDFRKGNYLPTLSLLLGPQPSYRQDAEVVLASQPYPADEDNIMMVVQHDRASVSEWPLSHGFSNFRVPQNYLAWPTSTVPDSQSAFLASSQVMLTWLIQRKGWGAHPDN